MTILNFEDRVTTILLEYAQAKPEKLPLDPKLTLRNDLSIESFSLVSIVLRLGDELGVDAVGAGVELHQLETVGDVIALAQKLSAA